MGLQEDEQSGAESVGFCGGSESAARTQRALPDLGVPVVWGTLGSMFDKITQSDIAWLSAITDVCCDLDSKFDFL